jgi:predicted protein tyrosine phosphatase
MAVSTHFISRFEAQEMSGDKNDIIISLNGTDEYPANLSKDWKAILQLEFDDVTYGSTSLKVFTQDQAKQIVDFVMKHHADTQRIYVHCHAGISRSAAVAMIVGDYLDIPIFSKNTPLNPEYSLYNKTVFRLLTKEFLGLEGIDHDDIEL